MAWHTAASWAKQVQQTLQQAQQQQQQAQQQKGQQTPRSTKQQQGQRFIGRGTGPQEQLCDVAWLQQSLAAGSTHWGPAAAVLDAAGPWLQLQHLLLITQTLVGVIADNSSSSSSRTSTDNNNNGGADGDEPAVELFKPNVLAVDTGAQHRAQVPHGSSSSSHSNSGVACSVRMLKSGAILPQLSGLLLQRLQQAQQQEQQEGHHASTKLTAPGSSSTSISSPPVQQAGFVDISNDTSILDTPTAVCLAQQLAQLHTTDKLGAVDAAVVAELVSHHVSLPQCDLTDMATLIYSCGQLGHPFRASWLAGFINEALGRLHQQPQLQQDGATAAAVATLLDGLSM